MTNSITTKDNLILKQGLSDWNNGFQHTIPVTATFTLFKYFNVVPSVNYVERWYTRKVLQSYDPEAVGGVRRDTINGFNRVYNYNMSLQVNTKLYGFFKPWKMFGDKVQMIRHVFTPSVGFSYAPDFGTARYGYYDTYTYTDASGEVRMVEYSPYQGMAFSVPGKGMQKSLNFSIDNNVEMKVKSDRDTTGIRKISLIDQLSANLGYNAAAKVRPWSDLSVNLRLKLTKSYTFSFNATWATYAYAFNDRGQVVVGDRTEWSYGRFGRFQGMSQNLSYTFNNKTLTKIKDWFNRDEEEGEDEDEDGLKSEGVDNGGSLKGKSLKDSKTKKAKSAAVDEDGYMPFKMPWNITVSYGIMMAENTSAKINLKTMRYPYKLTQNMNLSGNIGISDNWRINFTSGYNFQFKKLTTTTMNISRDLHCFEMSCGIVLSPYTSFNFSFRATSQMLADALKWDKRSGGNSNVEWY